ncbi:MAG: hypothetical protein AABY97_04300, partial [Chloroflexota bacterium]
EPGPGSKIRMASCGPPPVAGSVSRAGIGVGHGLGSDGDGCVGGSSGGRVAVGPAVIEGRLQASTKALRVITLMISRWVFIGFNGLEV